MNNDNRNICLKILNEYRQSDLHINDCIHSYFKLNDISRSDRAFINRLTLGAIRLKGRYDYILSQIYHGDYKELNFRLKNILRLACYQIEEMDSIPNHASIFRMVEITKKHLRGYEKLTNAILRKFVNKSAEIKLDINSPNTYPLLSHPDWIISRWTRQFGAKKTLQLCDYNNKIPIIWFRINDYLGIEKIYRDIKLLSLTIKKHALSSLFFKVNSPETLMKSNIFIKGYVSVQNPTNSFIVDALNPKNTETIIDGCSSPHGKGSLISLRAPNSKIYSIEINKKRIIKIKESINRHKLKNINILNLDMAKDELPRADKILLDVPCSGTGVVNRRVDLRWKRKEVDILKSAQLQEQILSNASKYLKRGGRIVYSTCSIEDEENNIIVENFIKKNRGYSLEDCSRWVNPKLVKSKKIDIFPGEYDLDGGFAATLKRI